MLMLTSQRRFKMRKDLLINQIKAVTLSVILYLGICVFEYDFIDLLSVYNSEWRTLIYIVLSFPLIGAVIEE